MLWLSNRHIKALRYLVLSVLLLGAVSTSLHRLAHLSHERATDSPVSHQNTRQDTFRDSCMACTLLSNMAFNQVENTFQVTMAGISFIQPVQPIYISVSVPRTYGARAPPRG